MDECRRILSSPLHLAGGLALDQLGSLVAIDAMLRSWAARGRDGEALLVPFSGSLAALHVVERELAKEGHDRESIGRERFGERVHDAEQRWRAEAAELLESLRVEAGAELRAASTDTDEVVAAARVAFVRLFDAGLLMLADRVVDMCPRCGTVVHAADAERGTIDAEELTVQFELSAGDILEVRVRYPELVAGTVAIAVSPGHVALGQDALVPLLGQDVPVVAGDLGTEPALVVPAHDATSHDIAVREGLRPVEVLQPDGTVSVPVALAGLTRFAARVETAALLEAEGAVVARQPVAEPVGRCRGCGTVLVPRLGRHWFLRTVALEVAVADAVRQGQLVFSPATARQDFINWIGFSQDWCISHQVWGGHPIPVATCTDCGEAAVGIEPPPACRKCMAALEPEAEVFDARFLGVVWSLVAAGWPGSLDGWPQQTALAVRPGGLFTWAVPMAALGLRLAGTIPFAAIVVHDASEVAVEARLDAAVAADDAPAWRLAVLGNVELAAAREVANRLVDPPIGGADVDDIATTVEAGFDDMRPGVALPTLMAALAVGIPATERSRLGRIVAPLIASGVQERGVDGMG